MASSNIAKLSVALVADTAKFTASMVRSTGVVKNFSAGVAKVGSIVAGATKAVVAMGAAVGVTAGYFVQRLVRNGLESVDAIAKVADATGEATEKIVALGHVANLAGADQETLNKGLFKLSRTISEAADGTGEGVDALDALGLSAQSLLSKSPVEQFIAIADAMQSVENSSDKVRYSMELLGRGGIDLINTMAGGSKAIREGMKEAEALGLTFSRLDAAKVEAANDAIDRLKALLTATGQILAIEFAPYITAAADKLVEMGTVGEGFGAKVVNGLEMASSAVAGLIDRFASIPSGIAFFVLDAGAKIARFIFDVRDGFYGLVDFAMPAISAIFSAFASGANDAAGSFRMMAGTILGIFSTMLEAIATGFNKVLPESMQIDTTIFDRTSKNLVENANANFARSKEIQDSQREGRTTAGMRERLGEPRDKAKEFADAFVGDLEAQAAEQFSNAMGRLNGGLGKQVSDFFSDIRSRAEEAAKKSIKQTEVFEDLEDTTLDAADAQNELNDAINNMPGVGEFAQFEGGTFAINDKSSRSGGKFANAAANLTTSGTEAVVKQVAEKATEGTGMKDTATATGGVAALIMQSNTYLSQMVELLKTPRTPVLG